MESQSNQSVASYSGLLQDIRTIINQGRSLAYSAASAVMIDTYWKVGRRIVEEEQKGKARAEYGTQLLEKLSHTLTLEFGKGFDARRLRSYRQFFLFFPQEKIWHTCVPNLNWSHFRELLRVEDETARMWYMEEASREGWNVRTLARNISSQYYQRLLSSPRKEPVVEEMKRNTAPYQKDKLEFIKNPLVAEFLGLDNNPAFTEDKLETVIIDHLQQFLMELGKGYAFVARQQHIATDAGDYFVDLVFYNYILKCFVLVDLKTSQITHQDVGQMDMYVRMYDEMKRLPGDNPTIGILLCSETSKDIARYSILHDSKQLFATKYMTYLPTQEQLRREIESQKELFRQQQSLGDKPVDDEAYKMK